MAAGSSRNSDGDGVGTRVALACVSASLSESATFPVDTVKTRLQLLRLPSRPSSLLVVSREILAKGGGGFYSGLSPAILRHLFYTPIRIVGYEKLRGISSSTSSTPTTPAAAAGVSLFSNALSGGASGVVAQLVASPTDLVKVRMQANPTMYTGLYHAFSQIIKSQGFFALWRGVAPNAQRAFLVNMGELTCYDHAKHFILSRNICHDNVFAHTLSSLCSGLCASVISCPADVIKTRMMNPPIAAGVAYQNSLDCLLRTIRDEGIRALWKGFFPTWAQLGPWQFVFWVSYEKLRQIVGLSSF